MLFITPTTNVQQAKDYYTRHMAPSDYYMRDAVESVGEWHGRGAKLLGLSGTVDKEDYFRLCENINPVTHEPLTARTKADRRVLYDFTFDAPKSVTLAYELGGDERIRDAFSQAVKDTMDEMENAMQGRVRKNNTREDRATSNMIWADFVHRTARPVDGVVDPQLHCHAVAINATYDWQEDRWKAAEFGNIVRDKGYYQAAFHSRLAEKLSALGYGIERDGNSFQLAGIGESLTEEFSRRSAVIEAEAIKRGITDAKTKGKLGQRTREAKPEEQMSIVELREAWKARISDGDMRAVSEARMGQESNGLDAAHAVDYAVLHSFERASVITKKNLLKTALIHSFGKATVDDVQSETKREGILHQNKNSQEFVTTRDVLLEELAMTKFARDGKGKRYKLGGETLARLDTSLSKEQHDAALVILNSRDTVTALKGKAGTGKTRMMQATVKAIETTGKQVYTFAPSAEASRGVLREEGFANADTVERLLIDQEMQKQVKGQVIWIDEAGLLSVKDMKRLFDVAKQQEARVILSGDTAQHNAVLRGDALRILQKDAGLKTAELEEIRRQTNTRYREAVKAISAGDVMGKDGRTKLEAGIGMLDGMGAIIETEGDARYKQIAEQYAEISAERKPDSKYKSVLVVSPTNAEAGRVTDAIRATLKEEGRIGADERNFVSLKSLNLTEAQRGDVQEYHSGNVVQFHQNAKGFKRGERVTVTGADAAGVHVARKDGSNTVLPLTELKKFQLYTARQLAFARGDRLRITQNGFTRETRRGLGKTGDRLNNGATYEVDGFTKTGDIKLTNGFVVPKDYGGISHGFVVTSHASQGKTVDVALVALGKDSFAAANREQFYVSVSRAREAVRVFTDDKAAMLEAVKGTTARLSASELMQGYKPKPATRPGIMARMFNTLRIQNAYKAIRERLAAVPEIIHPQQKGMSYGR
jgi:conjugative relaxase-like TrwC/TraI family protein